MLKGILLNDAHIQGLLLYSSPSVHLLLLESDVDGSYVTQPLKEIKLSQGHGTNYYVLLRQFEYGFHDPHTIGRAKRGTGITHRL